MVGTLASGLTACGATPRPAIGPVATDTNAALGQADYATTAPSTYRLRPSDKIAVKVFREPDISLEEVSISADGKISVPLAGSLVSAERTTDELASEIRQALLEAGLRRPIVNVNVVEYSSHIVTVEGGVQEPGVYSFQPGARLSSALSLAKGPSRVSKLQEVVIFRETEQGMAVALFDYQQVRQGTMADPLIEPGDRVVVGISGLSQFWQDLIRALPAFGLFTNI
ncbi:polysaccharide biosynthesis/export family protein [Altererythrobacter sp. Z27]|uniref:polysaccharide biosynthesis/export family protein n=1 Tax=Altererythrobacter sp. Z27 TaxID=3461147 RepID=UPI00404457FB